MKYAITYELSRPGREYDDLYMAIKSCGNWRHYLNSTWLVECNQDARGIYSRLKPHMYDDDIILVIGVTQEYDGWLPLDAWTWIK